MTEKPTKFTVFQKKTIKLMHKYVNFISSLMKNCWLDLQMARMIGYTMELTKWRKLLIVVVCFECARPSPVKRWLQSEFQHLDARQSSLWIQE